MGRLEKRIARTEGDVERGTGKLNSFRKLGEGLLCRNEL
jgi:hypothetical protein